MIKENGEIINDFSITCPYPNMHCCTSVALVIDRSASMRFGNPSALDQAKAGANAFITAMDGLCDEATLISFDVQATVDVFMTNDQMLLHQGVDALRASDASAIWDAAIIGIQELVNNGTQECRAVLLFTDGNDGLSKNTLDDLISLALANKIRVFTIGYGIGINDQDLSRIASDTGGRYYKIPDPSSVVEIYKEISTIIGGGFYECEIDYTSKCMDGTRRYVELILQNLTDCAGTDKKTKSYKSPRDTTSFQSVQMRIGSSLLLDDRTASLPLLLETPINVLSKGNFTLMYDTTQCTFVSIDTKSFLLDSVKTIVTPITNGVRVTTLNPTYINRYGVLTMLNFKAVDTSTFSVCPISIPNWRLDSGCFIPKVTSGEIIASAPFTLITPRGGEALCTGTSEFIRWFRSTIQSIDIDISADSGKTFYPIARAVTGNSYEWHISDTMKTGAYILKITDHGGSAFDISDSTFYIQSAPKITAHPSDTTSCTDQTIRFIAHAKSFDKPFVQWQSSADSGATWAPMNMFSDTLIVPYIHMSQKNFLYRAIFTNSCGLSTTTNAAHLSITAFPKINQQPIDQTVCENQNAIFHIVGDSLSGSKIQWQVSNDNGRNFSSISGSTQNDLLIKNASKQLYGNLYRALLTNPCTTIVSKAARLTVRPYDIWIETQPPADNCCEGDNLTFIIHAVNPVSFQWQKNGVLLPAETLSTFKIKSLQNSDHQSIVSAIIKTDCGEYIPPPITLIINPQTKILQQPVSRIVQPNQSVTFFVKVSGTNLTYQWIKNDTIFINDANDSSYTINKVQLDDEGTYRVMIFNKCDTIVISHPAKLIVRFTRVDNSRIIPQQPILYQNFPNPFSQETAIGYRLSAYGNVRLEIFDLYGRKLATLIDEKQEAGIHNYDLKPESLNLKLNTGIYMCVMHVDGRTLMKQMVVMK